jgi:hypothetical protein
MLVVVNGSGGWNGLQPVAGGGFALEKAGLLKSQGVQYDVSTAHRRRALFDRFTDDGAGLDGVFVQISDSPYKLAGKFIRKPDQPDDDLSRRAGEVIAALNTAGYTEDWWDATVKDTSGTATTLAKLGPDRTVQLFEHGYVLTVVNLYVLHGLGSLSIFGHDQFRKLVRGS